MINDHGNFYALLYITVLSVAMIGLYTAEPSTTGFVVLEDDFSEFDVNIVFNENNVCADGSFYQECSSVIKGKYCHLGTLTDYCELCGCYEGEECINRKCV